MDGPEKQTQPGHTSRRGAFSLPLVAGVWLVAAGCAQDDRYAADPLLGNNPAARAAAPVTRVARMQAGWSHR